MPHFQSFSRDGREMGINGERPLLAEWAFASRQSKGTDDLLAFAFWACREGSLRINHELFAAFQAKMRRIVADAAI